MEMITFTHFLYLITVNLKFLSFLTSLVAKKNVANEGSCEGSFFIITVVFHILKLLHSILSESSKPFALHMISLMHHNLGEMMYNIFISIEVS